MGAMNTENMVIKHKFSSLDLAEAPGKISAVSRQKGVSKIQVLRVLLHRSDHHPGPCTFFFKRWRTSEEKTKHLSARNSSPGL
jgi:hypothetical protein